MPGLRPTHVKKLSPCEQSEQGCGQYIYIIYTTYNVFFLRKVPKEQSIFDVVQSNPDPGPAPQLNPAMGAM